MGADGSSLRADSDDSASRLRNLRIENAITRRTKAQNTERPGGIFHCCAAFPNARKARDIPLPIAVSISKDWIASELQVHAGRKNEKNQFLLAVIHREMKFFFKLYKRRRAGCHILKNRISVYNRIGVCYNGSLLGHKHSSRRFLGQSALASQVHVNAKTNKQNSSD